MILLTAILGPFLLFEERIAASLSQTFVLVRAHPALGGALIIALLAGDCVLPVPSSLVSAFAGAAFDWSIGAVIIWTGMCLGCAASYGLGLSAGRILAIRLVGEHELARARRLFSDLGPAALVVTRAVPVLAEAGALAAGAARMPFWPFMGWTSLANAGVAVAYAATGAAAASSGSFLIVFTGLAALPALAWGVWRVLIHPRRQPLESSI